MFKRTGSKIVDICLVSFILLLLFVLVFFLVNSLTNAGDTHKSVFVEVTQEISGSGSIPAGKPVVPIYELISSCQDAFLLSYPGHVTFRYEDDRNLFYVWITVEDEDYNEFISAYQESNDVTAWYDFSCAVEDISREWQTKFSFGGHPDTVLLTSIVHPFSSDTNTVLARFVSGQRTEDSIDRSSSQKAVASSAASPALTLGQENALRSARSYLSFSAFSWSGLVKQLEFEGYTHDEAVYAANSCGADWNEQAAKSAKSYLCYIGFSRSGLIEQLEFEGFTHDQAVYGVTKAGY